VWYPNLHEPLIDQKTYDKIQKALESHSKERKYLYLFRGIISCSCGHPMVCSSSYNSPEEATSILSVQSMQQKNIRKQVAGSNGSIFKENQNI